MKKMRRIASVLLALAMVFGLTATAFAAEVENQTEHSYVAEVENQTGHSYAAYQVFSGTQQESVEEGDKSIIALGDIEWGRGVGEKKGGDLLKELNDLEVEGATPFANCKSAADVAAVLNKEKDYTSAIAKAFANAAVKHRTESFTEIPAGAASVPLDIGYYLLVDTGNPDGSSPDAYNSALLQITNQKITIKKKYDVPTVDKAVKDKEDGEAGEAVDVNIGDSVYFTLTGTLPNSPDNPDILGDYETYKYAFTDTLSKGLKYNGNAKVYLFKDGSTENGADGNKVDITDSFTIEHTPADPAPETGGGGILKVSIDNLKTVEGVSAESVIVVEYSAELTADAVTGGSGNVNTVKLEYSNNPNTSGDGESSTGETPEDKAIVFTYKLDGTKVDGKNPDKMLKDAEFILFRLKKGETELSYTEADGKRIPANVEYALVDNGEGKLIGWIEDRAAATADTNVLKSNGDGEFKIAGLDAGTYYLEETKAPAGYNQLKEPVKLTIRADIDQGDDEKKKDPSLTNVEIGTPDEDGNDAFNPGDTTNGTVSLKVQNNMGALLPSTGGMGTTLFYIAGAALVLAAGVLLMMKRRTDAGK